MTLESAAISAKGASAWEVDWRRLGRRALMSSFVLLAVMTLWRNAAGSEYGFDFHGMWKAGREVLAGHSPYLAPEARTCS